MLEESVPARESGVGNFGKKSSLISESLKDISRAAEQRLKDLGVRVSLNSQVTAVEKGLVSLKNGEKISFDLLLWTAAGQAKNIIFDCDSLRDKDERLEVNEFFQVKNFHNIFALGCLALMPGNILSQCSDFDVLQQAEFVAQSFSLILQNRRPSPYKSKTFDYSLNIGGKWAIVKTSRGLFEAGYMAYLIIQWQNFKYFRNFLGFKKAWKKIFQ